MARTRYLSNGRWRQPQALRALHCEERKWPVACVKLWQKTTTIKIFIEPSRGSILHLSTPTHLLCTEVSSSLKNGFQFNSFFSFLLHIPVWFVITTELHDSIVNMIGKLSRNCWGGAPVLTLMLAKSGREKSFYVKHVLVIINTKITHWHLGWKELSCFLWISH